MDKEKTIATIFLTSIASAFNILLVPVLLLVTVNIIDYITGLIAAYYRGDTLSSYKSFKGILKKIMQWLLVMVGFLMDILVNYSLQYAGIDFQIPFIISVLVAIWLVINEILSILENIIDIGVKLPPFLKPLAKKIRKDIEDIGKETKHD